MPLIKNEIYTAEITGYTAEGAGVARIDGQVVFVPGALEGEEIRVKIIKVAKSLCYGRVEEILTPSPERVLSACPAFPKCGGCDLWHMSRKEELKMKTCRVRDALCRIGGFEKAPMEPIIAQAERGRYRNKCMFPVGERDGQMISGFFRSHSHDIVVTPDCLIQKERANEIRDAVCVLAPKYGISAYDELSGKVILRNIYLRCGDAGDMLCLVVTEKPKRTVELAKELTARFPSIKNISLNINKTRGNTLLGEKLIPIVGEVNWEDSMCALTFCISPLAFYQVNREQAERLYAKAIEYAELTADTFAVDLYCGAGTITLNLAKKCARVLGVEVVPEAIEDARENARINSIENAEFICADAGEAASRLAACGERPDVIVVDPPRKGMDEVGLSAMVRMSPEKIVYVSCDVATLARDLKFLCQNGYTLTRVCPVDMFPATRHVECVAQLRRDIPSF